VVWTSDKQYAPARSDVIFRLSIVNSTRSFPIELIPRSLSTTASLRPAPDIFVLHLSEDTYKADATFTVSVDGVQVGGIESVTALHATGTSQHISFAGGSEPVRMLSPYRSTAMRAAGGQ
jgi:hypothetical protein